MFFQFIRLQFLQAVRSVSLGCKLIGGIVLGILGLIILLNILAVGAGLPFFIENVTGRSNVTRVLNGFVLFFFFMELLYRYFLQKISALDLESFLYLPIRRSRIVHYLFLRSFLSPL